MGIQRKWAEAGVMEFDFKPLVNTTTTEAKWRELAADGNILVKTVGIGTNDELVSISPCNASSDTPVGVLRAITGDPSDFPSKFVARVAVCAVDCNVDGAGTGALAESDRGDGIQPDANGKATIVASGGHGKVIGGTKENLRLAFDWVENIG